MQCRGSKGCARSSGARRCARTSSGSACSSRGSSPWRSAPGTWRSGSCRTRKVCSIPHLSRAPMPRLSATCIIDRSLRKPAALTRLIVVAGRRFKHGETEHTDTAELEREWAVFARTLGQYELPRLAAAVRNTALCLEKAFRASRVLPRISPGTSSCAGLGVLAAAARRAAAGGWGAGCARGVPWTRDRVLRGRWQSASRRRDNGSSCRGCPRRCAPDASQGTACFQEPFSRTLGDLTSSRVRQARGWALDRPGRTAAS